MTEKNIKALSFTARELLEILKEYPLEMPVVASGYENGHENFHHPTEQKVKYLQENKY